MQDTTLWGWYMTVTAFSPILVMLFILLNSIEVYKCIRKQSSSFAYEEEVKLP